MRSAARLVEIYRGSILECVHEGCIAVVDEGGLGLGVGDVDFFSYYRSSSKPMQVLPLYELDVPHSYGLTEEELSIMSGSLAGSPRQVDLARSIMTKADLSQEDLVMLPCYPLWESYATLYKKEGREPSKLFHNCIGKHLALMLMQRALGGEVADYYKMDSAVQQRILTCISALTEVPREEIGMGWDGCGVPVFAVSVRAQALSYLRLAATDLIQEPSLAAAAKTNARILARYPQNLMDEASVCGVLCKDDNIIGKLGADGVYTLGLKKERLGVALKVMDGSTAHMGLLLAEILKQLDYENEDTVQRLLTAFPSTVENGAGHTVGRKKAVFQLRRGAGA